MNLLPEHGGELDKAIAQYGGTRAQWLDLSTGINPTSYPFTLPEKSIWQNLPESGQTETLNRLARGFWNVPQTASILATAGVSQIIALLPLICEGKSFSIHEPTYSEHRKAFEHAGWQRSQNGAVSIIVHPNNPDGRLFTPQDIPKDDTTLHIIDESFCDTLPEATMIALCARNDVIVLKGIGKFWGLGGIRLGFAIGNEKWIDRLSKLIGPWPVSGPALEIGAQVLGDPDWAKDMRTTVQRRRAKFDQICADHGINVIGGCGLFRLIECKDAQKMQDRLAHEKIWIRRFAYDNTWLRFGLPERDQDWRRLETALRNST